MSQNELPEKKFYTPSDVAERLPISKLSVYKAIQRGEIPSVKIGRKIIIPAKAFKRIFPD